MRSLRLPRVYFWLHSIAEVSGYMYIYQTSMELILKNKNSIMFMFSFIHLNIDLSNIHAIVISWIKSYEVQCCILKLD